MNTPLAIGKKVLLTTSQWFYAPNGRMYNAVFGTVKALHGDKEALGIATNRNSTNWYIEIGNMLIAGCQVHYAVQSESVNLDRVLNWKTPEGGATEIVEFENPSPIYNADAD